MANLVAVNNQQHQQLKVNPAKAELHGAELNLIPVVLSEFINVAVQYPIVLTKNGDTGEFVFTAMLGFETHENLFWQQGQWQGLYLPLQIQRQPFFLGENSNGEGSVVCIDLDSPMLANKSSEAQSQSLEVLYTSAGEESDYFNQAKQCLGQLLQGEHDNKLLIEQLKAFDLIQPLSFEITFVNQQKTRLNGLYTINQDKLAALTSEQVTKLHQQNLLQPIYTLITAMGQMYALIERKNQKLSA